MDATRQPKLEAKNVRLSYYNERMKRRLEVLDGIDLAFEDGEIDAIQHFKPALHPFVVIAEPDVLGFELRLPRCVHPFNSAWRRSLPSRADRSARCRRGSPV